MISEKLRRRLQPDRPTKRITVTMPEDVLEELREVADREGYSSVPALIRAVVGQHLRRSPTPMYGEVRTMPIEMRVKTRERRIARLKQKGYSEEHKSIKRLRAQIEALRDIPR